ncbi:transcriptional regulator, LacI family [Beutenbergia cavernae DSM 12333]|uniref:Transcriptional regulator, LacI family n=1 Tax=Beutenbergia cavernae (strain ATCC BAA-8 / DSM 12333 / CCUG 43141 / JCM 11478 / NBRC 16432 / NCIMB 13614 / HKI 0122) TaxID=471853 RepID=C5C0M9_BEUC1|nr:substrate-binding domain-containing protein [Beutenbergia cavernae]ACQ81425.1 transcriptional regulator, LacI family [Beutenbergia cavernae DSM 12333]
MGRPTLADVAAAAGVSPSTASLAFSGAGPVAAATRERVMAAAAQLGYTGPNPIARSLRRGQSGVVGVITGRHLSRSFRDPVSVQTLDGIADALGARDLGMLLIPFDDAAPGVPQLVAHAAMDAAIMIATPAPGDRALRTLLARDVPTVTLDSRHRGTASVRIADRAGMRDLASEVVALGHTRIAVLTLPFAPGRGTGELDPDHLPRPTYTPTRNRLAGVRDAGIRPVAVVEAGASLVEEGFEAARRLLARDPRPTAIIAFSDLLAAGVVLAARELGLDVPGDLTVTGFDGVDLPWLAPDVLASAMQPFVHKGTLAAEAAAALIAGEDVRTPDLTVVPRPGTTTGPPPH